MAIGTKEDTMVVGVQVIIETNSVELSGVGQKSTLLIFNFITQKYQFSTRLMLKDTLLEIQNETKLLGVIINNNLTWEENMSTLIKKSYARMQILHKLYQFSIPIKDLIIIYIIYIRCYLEQSCVVWHASLTEQQRTNLERVQRVALRIILKDHNVS